jgi:hypothetical protein
MWLLVLIGVLAVFTVFLGIFVMRKGRQKLDPMQSGMAVGGIVGMIVGILLVEFWGYEYPLPFVLWLLGMAGGQLIGWFYKRKQ